jgi:hypothetical protein
MKRDKTAKEKELADNERLLRAWRQWHREQLDEVLAGPHGAAVALVVGFLDGMGPQSAPALIALLDQHDWGQIDHNVRYVLLHEINQTVTRVRERAGLPPIDDALPGQRMNAFLRIKETLFPRKAESPPGRPGKTNGDNDERYNKSSIQDR